MILTLLFQDPSRAAAPKEVCGLQGTRSTAMHSSRLSAPCRHWDSDSCHRTEALNFLKVMDIIQGIQGLGWVKMTP